MGTATGRGRITLPSEIAHRSLRPGEPERDADGVAAVQFELWPSAYRFARG